MYLDTYGTGTKSDAEILSIVNANFDLRPGVIRRELNLTRPIYEKTAYHGHFGECPLSSRLSVASLTLPPPPGRSLPEFTWEHPKPLKY